MFEDPIIGEIRKIRREIEAECQNNPQKYYEHIRQLQQKYSNRLVRRKPKPAVNIKNKVASLDLTQA